MFYQYNTGGVGEILERTEVGGQVKKNLVRKAVRVPIDLMAALQRGDLRGSNEYATGRLGTEEVVRCEGGDLAAFDPANFYSAEQIGAYLRDLVEGRRAFTEEIAAQGLRKEIRDLAHKSLDRIEGTGRRAEPWAPPEHEAAAGAAEDRSPRSRWITSWEPRRPGREFRSFTGGRSRGAL